MWFLIGVGLVVGLMSMQDYWANFFNGPYAISESNSAALMSLDKSRSFVTVTGSQVIDSGVREYTTETRNGVKQGEYVSSSYSVLLVGNYAVVVKGNAPLSATGELKALPPSIPALIFPDEKDAALKDRLYPVMLDTTDNYRVGGYMMIGAVLIYGLLIWFIARKTFAYTKNISLHPVVQRVESWPDHIEVVAVWEREMGMPRFTRSGVVVTDTFVINRGVFTFNILPWNHLLWAYRKETTTRYYGVIPISRSQEAVMHFYGGSVSFGGGKKGTEQVLAFAAQQAPWAVLGYNDALAFHWKKKTQDFADGVRARREEFFSSTSGAPPPPLST